MNLHIVLVRTENPSNVGAAMRAMANMGGQRLILVDPKCELDSKARQMAAGAASRLAEVVRYNSWQDFYATEQDGIRIALTRRGGRKRKLFPLKQKVCDLREHSPQNMYLIFGPEADGLDNSDMALVNFSCHLPVHGDFASLNLAQAVLLSAYIVREEFPADHVAPQITNTPTIQPFYFPDKLIKDWLIAMGFDIQARRSSAYLTLRRLFMQNLPTQHELQVLEAILQQNVRKLQEPHLSGHENQGLVGLPLEQLADNLRDIAGEKV